MSREIEAHLALLQDEFERQGLPPQEAQRAARRAYGGVEQTKELHREARSFTGIEQLFKDIRYGWRNLRRTPGFTITAVAVLALGIGATTAVFSIVNAILLKPFPIPDPDHLVMLVNTQGEGFNPTSSPPMFAHWQAQSSVLQDITAFTDDEVMNYTGGDVLEQWRSSRVSTSFFHCLGISIVRGRTFTQEEDRPHGPDVAVITQALWARRFASDPATVGKTVSLNGKPYTVVGIVADDAAWIEFGPDTEVYLPFQLDPNSTEQGQFFLAMGRLKPGVTLTQAKEQVQASTGEFRKQFPLSLGEKSGFGLMTIREFFIGDIGQLMAVLLSAVGLVLLIACANVANLLLVRGAGRRREIGIRAAIGATRGRIARQFLIESVLLSLVSGAVGLLLGYGGIRALLIGNAEGLERLGENGAAVFLDWRLLGFALAVSLLAALLFGVFPALNGSRVDLNSVLKDGGRWGTGLRQGKARAALVVSEVGLAVILLVGSALLIRSFTALYKVDRGFETKNVLTMRTLLAGPKYATSAGVENALRNGLEHIRALPGVEAASTTCCVPLQGQNGLPFEIVGRPSADGALPWAGWTTASPGLFDVFKIPVKRGRAFNERDGANAPPVAMINETMANLYFKDHDPLNERIVIGKAAMKEFRDEPARQIVGVVADVRDTGLNNAPRPVMYVPWAQLPDYVDPFWNGPMAWVVRTGIPPQKLAPAIQEQVRQATGVPVSDLLLMDDVVSRSTARQRLSMMMMTIFGCAALLLAAIGIYGLMAYTVEQRTQEIGIRLALGAEAGQLRNMVVRQGMGLALAGVVVGLGAAWGVSRLMESLLFGVKPRDPIVFVVVPVALTAVALLAVWLPARRALRVDPAIALRHE
jgi:putative ABC transport system permease protein